MGVYEKEGREVAFGSFDSPRPQTCGDCRNKLSNDRNGRRKLIVGVSSLLVLPKVATGPRVQYWLIIQIIQYYTSTIRIFA